MFLLKNKLIFVTVNQNYLKYLHENCSEVYYKPSRHDKKPYIGIFINLEKNQYVIPLSSAKEKHKSWKNIEMDRFLIYENCKESVLSSRAVYKKISDSTVMHILSVIDIKKMIPIKDGLYKKVDLVINQNDSIKDRKTEIIKIF